MGKIYIILTGFLFLLAGCQPKVPEIRFEVKSQEKKVDVLVDGMLFTSYIYPEEVKKPVLWPIVSSCGDTVTRCFPMLKKSGERTDHPHHVGMWLNYENVNGLDFWNNSEAIPIERRNHYGTIYQRSIEKAESGKGKGVLSVVCDWDTPQKEVLLKENTSFTFRAGKNIRIIDRTTRLTAIADTVTFDDVKDGMFGMRVARSLELPSEEPVILTDSHGIATKVGKMDNTGVTGNYRSSEGIEGAKVWSTRARWMKLWGKVNNKTVSLIIIDNPNNVNYPTYWHARGYGLFAANPLGEKIFSKGKKELNYMLKKGEILTFRYRFVLADGNLTDEKINKIADEYSDIND